MAQGVLLAQRPVPTQSRDQGAVGLGETPRGSRRVGVCGGWLPLDSPCERCAQHHGEGRRAWASREGSAAPSPRWTPHIPSFPAKKTDCEGLDTHWCCEVSPPPSSGTWGAHPTDSRRVEYPIPYVAPRWVSHPMRGHQMEVPSMCVQPLGITFHLYMVHVISALWPQGCTSYTCSLRCMSCPIYAQALRCMSHPPYSPWYT